MCGDRRYYELFKRFYDAKLFAANKTYSFKADILASKFKIIYDYNAWFEEFKIRLRIQLEVYREQQQSFHSARKFATIGIDNSDIHVRYQPDKIRYILNALVDSIASESNVNNTHARVSTFSELIYSEIHHALYCLVKANREDNFREFIKHLPVIYIRNKENYVQSLLHAMTEGSNIVYLEIIQSLHNLELSLPYIIDVIESSSLENTVRTMEYFCGKKCSITERALDETGRYWATKTREMIIGREFFCRYLLTRKGGATSLNGEHIKWIHRTFTLTHKEAVKCTHKLKYNEATAMADYTYVLDLLESVSARKYLSKDNINNQILVKDSVWKTNSDSSDHAVSSVQSDKVSAVRTVQRVRNDISGNDTNAKSNLKNAQVYGITGNILASKNLKLIEMYVDYLCKGLPQDEQVEYVRCIRVYTGRSKCPYPLFVWLVHGYCKYFTVFKYFIQRFPGFIPHDLDLTGASYDWNKDTDHSPRLVYGGHSIRALTQAQVTNLYK